MKGNESLFFLATFPGGARFVSQPFFVEAIFFLQYFFFFSIFFFLVVFILFLKQNSFKRQVKTQSKVALLPASNSQMFL
jgi:hypothetical protein